MCGIVGIGSCKNKIDRSRLQRGIDKIMHRGPDGEGVWWSIDGRLGLGHRRLAIIDLSIGANQPMLNSTGKFVIIFNGEIYNYLELKAELSSLGAVFNSKSDTEVVLEAYRIWGYECLSKFNGMFAFAIFDIQKETLFLARDRAGEKPLFYSLQNGELRFASEIKALIASTPDYYKINPLALDCFLNEGYVPDGYSILQGINKLPPANALIFDLNSGKFKSWNYWQLPELSEISGTKFDEIQLLEDLETLLQDAVSKQLVADVSVGVLLSGGVDSSLITAMAVKAKSNISTFTIRFPGFGKHDETEHARLIARFFGTKHIELEAEQSNISLLPKLAAQFDEPIIDSSMIPTYLVSKLIRTHCTVALGGDGGDELFGGYSHYDKLLKLQRKARPFPYWMREAISKSMSAILPIGYKGRNWIQAFGVDFKSDLPLIANYFNLTDRKALLGNDFHAFGMAEKIRNKHITYRSDLLQLATRTDFKNYLAEDILVKVDRASMLNSLEIRAPFLDYRVIEFAFGKVPSSLKATSNNKKILLKKLATKLLPTEFDIQRKQGFSIPLSSWLEQREWVNFFSEVLYDRDQVLFNHKMIQKMMEGQKNGYNTGEQLFGLVMFELWRKTYNISL
jgi:asparagine synthase (glutamine-hydrolysing)